MNINSLRGGGCGASKKIQKKHEKEKQRGQQKVYKNDKKTMASSIQYHSESIFKNAIIAMSEKEKLMFSFQFFLDNRQELWGIIVNDEDGNQIVDVVLNNIKPLLEALKILIKGFVGYSVYLSQIISLLSWIVFCFYINTKNSDRFMKKEDQAKYLDAINEIKQEIEIEQNIGKYQNNLDYELYIIESIFTIVPTNNDELQEIAQSFLIGAATSFLSFSINDQFLDSLKRSVIYIYHEHDKACRKKMLKIIFALLQLKYEIVNKLQINTNPNSDHLERLNKVYQEVISQSSDWQIWCTWTKVLSQLFQQKLILPYKMIQILQISEQHFIHKNKIDLGQNQTEEICWLNLDSKLIESNSTAKLLYQNISQLQELGRLQYSILYGYQQIPSFETLYSSKLTQSMEKENYDAFQFNLSTISIMQHNAQEIKKAQLQFQQHIELLSITNKSKIQDINNNLSKAITNTIQLLEYIYSLHEIDNPKKNELESPKQSPLIQQSQYFQQSQVVNKSKDNKGDQKSEEVWFEEIVKLKKSQCKIFVSFFLKSIQKNSFQDKDIDKDNKDKEKEKDKEQDKDKDKEKDKIKDKEQDKEKIKNEATVEFGKDFIINERNQQGSDSIIQDQRYQLNILDILEEISKNRSKKKKKNNDFEEIVQTYKQTPFEVINLQHLQTRLKYIKIEESKHKMNNDKNYLLGFQEGISLLEKGSAFLRWNLRLLIKMKFYIQELDKNQYNDEQTIQIIQSLKGFSQQLASIQSIQRCIKYFYSKYETCIKYKLIVKSQQKRNVIYQILKNITLRKFQTLNMVYQIHKETLRKVKEEGVIYICQSIFQAIQSEHQKFLDDIIQLKRAVQMINDILNAYERNNNKDQDELQFFQNNDILVQYSIEYPDNQAIYLKNTDSLFQISLYNQNYSTQFTKWQKKNNNQSQDITDQINSKKQLIKQYIEKIELAQGYKTIQEEDNSFKQELYLEVNQLFDKLKEFKIQNQQEQENQDGNREFSFNQTKEFFNSLIGILKEIEHNVQIQFDNLKFINQQQGIFSTLINNSLLLKRASSYKNKIDQNEKIMKDLVGKYEEKLPEQVYQYHSLQTLFDQFKIDLNPNLKSEIFFILTQIWKKEDVTSDPSYYDQFKEAASDLINKNKWRIRQSCIYELLQFKNSCLTQATVDLAKGQLVRFQIYETDKRNKQLLDEQDQNQVVTMFQQCWASQEDDVQSKIKQKLEELNDIAYKITIETKQYEKSKYKKRYVELESEIQGIIKNAERLGNSLGTSLLFFQDIKNDLVNIQSQLKNLQGSIDQIHKDIQQLQGRSIKDLLVIRMQRVLQQRIIFNSENFYVPIKTKEKQVLENIEDEETPLYTDDLFGNGEINEFIWKQQKSSLLIHGQAGSGKSTAARKIEEFLWLLYKKNMNIAESIPIIPILIFLPQLTDPLSMAMEETLKSDNYRFNDKQILEFKEAVEQNQFKLIIIMDSYDEIKSEFTNRNLILSNKLYKWRCQSDEQKFPKIITTSRSEMFVNSDYRSWFLPERDNLQYYKEIRLLNFSREQVNIFIENYCILQVKKIIKDFFFNQKDNPGFFAFEELFIEVLKVINDNEQQDDKKDKKFLLSKSQINKISSLCDSFVTGDISFSMTQQLEEVWCQEYYQKNIKEMDLDSLLETPFMIEIVASVLPQMIKHRQELNTFKESFFKKLQQLNNMSREQIQKEWQRIVSNEKFLEEHLKVSNDSDREQIINKYFDKLENFKNLQSALRLDPLCSYDFYDQFFAQYFKRQINKLKDSGESLVYISNLADLWEFTHRLANDMTLSQLSQVKYIPRIQLFQKNKDSDWRDIYFNDEQEQGQIKKLFRKIMPLKQQYGIYSFNHKSLQEFLVAKWLIQSLELCNPDLYQKNQLTKKDINEIDAQLDDLCVHNLSKDFLNGVVKFMVDKLSSNSFLQQKLYDIVQFSKYIHEQIKEQDKVKISQNISIKRSQTQNLASQTISQNQYSDQEIAQRIMQASSNSLYLLHKLKCSLSSTNADLSNIQINDIELVKGNFFESQLNNSKFSKVNISQCNFNFANLNDVQWTDIQIDELPSIETKIQRNDLQHFHYVKSRDRLLCVSKYKDRWYDYKEQVEDKFTLKEFEQQNLKYILISQHDSQIALLCNDKIILISLTKTKIFKFPESFTVEAMCFTNKENEIIVVSDKFIKTIKTDFNEEEKIISNDAKDEISLQNTQIKNFTQIGILGEHIIIASEQKILICLEKKIYEFFYKCQHENCDSQLDNKNQKEKIPKCKHFLKYYCFEISLNQNYITLGYLQQTESHDNYVSILLIIDQQALIQTQVEENCMTVLQFTSLEIKNENQLKFKFVDDDKYLLSLSYKNNITYMRLWNYKEKKIVSCTMLDFQIKYITKITELLIATINQKGTIQIWDLQALLQQQNSNFNSTITSCIFSIKNHIISGNNDGIIQIWDRERGIQIGKNLQYHKSGVQSMTTYFKNTEILISGDFQGYINVCDLQTQQLLKSISTISPIKSLDFIQNSNHDIQLVTHSQFYHYLQLWSQDFESYSLFNQEEDNVIIQQSNLESTIQILHNKQTKCQPKSYSGLKNITDCSAFAIGKYTNNIYFAVYEFKNEDSNFKDVFIKVYREDFQDSKEQQKKDQAQELLVPLGIIYLAFAKEKNIEIVSIIKEVDQQNLLVSTEKTVFIIKLKKLSIEYKFRYPSFGKIRDLQIDEDLLFICGEIVSITNIRTGQLIPQTIQKPNENQQQSQIEGEQDLYCSLAYYRQKNTLFLGTTSGKIINYDLLYCNSQVYEQHSKEIIYLQIHSKQISTGRQDFLVTAAKDSFIKFWPLAIQDLKSIKPTETYQAILEDQIINKLWYFEKENFFICQNQKGCYVFAYFSNIQNPCYYFISESDPLMKCDYNNAKQILYQFTQNKNKNYSVQFTKTMVLQEALKAYYQEKNSYKIEIMLIDHNRQQIITSDEDGKIIFWDHNGKQLLDPIQAFEDDSSTQVCISLSKDLQTLICGCFQGGKQSQYFLTTISLKDKTKIQSQLDLGKLEQPKIKQLQQLSSKLFLILTDSLGDNINIYSLEKGIVIQKIKDRSGKSNGSSVLISEKGEAVFVTYGEFNQLTYYQSNKGIYAPRFIFGDAIKKFSCINTDTAQARITSKHDINLMKIFNPEKQENLKQK